MGKYLTSFTNESYDSLRVGKPSHNNEIGMYETTSIFSYQSSWGISRLRDDITATGTSTTTDTNGSIRLSTGTTAGSTLSFLTVKTGEYQPGKTAETGVGAKVISSPVGDGDVKIGIYDALDGFFWQIKADGIYTVVRTGGVDFVQSQSEWNADVMDGSGLKATNPSGRTFDITTPYIFVIRFSYYGVGPIVFELQEPGNTSDTTEMVTTVVTKIRSTNFPSVRDPNKPIAVEIDNGTSTDDIIVDVAGRRYDILGSFNPTERIVGEFRSGVTVSDTGFTPIIGLRKKAEFPVGRGLNSVACYIENITVITDVDLVFYVFLGSTIDGTWTVPTEVDTLETAIEVNIDNTAFSVIGDPLLGPLISTVSSPGKSDGTATKITSIGVNVPAGKSVVIGARAIGGATAAVSAVMHVAERW